jgi:hypothetical protein
MWFMTGGSHLSHTTTTRLFNDYFDSFSTIYFINDYKKTGPSIHSFVHSFESFACTSFHPPSFAIDHTLTFPWHYSRRSGAFGVTRKLLQLRVVDLLQLRASQLTGDIAEGVCELRQRSKKDIRLGLGCELESEAGRIVAFEQTFRVEKPAGEIADIDAGEGIGRAGVAATVLATCNGAIKAFGLDLPSNTEEFGVQRAHVQDIREEVGDGVGVLNCTFVPVRRDGLVALLDAETARFAADTEPTCQNVVGELALGVLSRVVRHEAVDESVACRLNGDSAERTIEEVRVVGDLVVPALRAEIGQGVHGDDAVGGVVDEVLVLVDHEQVVVAGFVEIRPRGGAVGFVPGAVSMP